MELKKLDLFGRGPYNISVHIDAHCMNIAKKGHLKNKCTCVQASYITLNMLGSQAFLDCHILTQLASLIIALRTLGQFSVTW